MLGEMARFPMHGNGNARLDPAVHLLALLAPRVAGDVHELVGISYEIATELHQPV